jgi:hypothetical protein
LVRLLPVSATVTAFRDALLARSRRAAAASDQVAGSEQRPDALRWISLLVVVAFVSSVGLWAISPRFEIDTPSLVDDWSGVSRSPDQLPEIARFANPEQQRFRPGWILWNYLQWHTLDAPDGRVGPNAWNAARLVVLVAGLSVLTALALPRPRRPREALLQAGLAGIPPLLVVSAPSFGIDLARFGPQEPLLVGGMALGGSLLVVASRSLLDSTRPLTAGVAVAAVSGTVLWVVGAYHKETSLAALPMIVAVAVAGRSRLARWRELGTRRRAALTALSAVVVLPLLHVAVESARIVLRGDHVYGEEVDGGLGTAARFVDLVAALDDVLPPYWRLCALAAVVLTVLISVVRRRVDVLAVGALSSSALVLLLAGQSGDIHTRYYIPAFALAVVPLSLSLARLPQLVQLVVVVVAVVALVPPTTTRGDVRVWTYGELLEAKVVREVAGLVSTRCVVAVAGLDVEREQALPVVVAMVDPPSASRCTGRETYLVAGSAPAGRALLRACAPGNLALVLQRFGVIDLYRCDALRSKPVRDPDYGLVDPERLVALRRLRVDTAAAS